MWYNRAGGVTDMTTSKAQLQAIAKYKAKAYKRIPLDYPAAEYDALKQAALNQGETVNGFIKAAIRDRLAKMNRK